MRDLSIVMPTCNRANHLSQCLDVIRAGTSCDYEVVLVDGASTDGTKDVIARARETMGDRLNVITESQREGFVRATNKGFRAATGRCVTWLNDDARPIGKSLDNAVAQVFSADEKTGIVALFHNFDTARGFAYERIVDGRPFRLLHVRGTLYANFGLGRLSTWRDLGFFDERFYLWGADPDFSMKAWHAGLKVVPADDAYIDHDQFQDDRRNEDKSKAKPDIARLSAKWIMPKYNPQGAPFDPANPCTVRGLSGPLRRAVFYFNYKVRGKIR